MQSEQPREGGRWWGAGLSAESVSQEVWPSGLDSSPQIPLDPWLYQAGGAGHPGSPACRGSPEWLSLPKSPVQMVAGVLQVPALNPSNPLFLAAVEVSAGDDCPTSELRVLAWAEDRQVGLVERGQEGGATEARLRRQPAAGPVSRRRWQEGPGRPAWHSHGLSLRKQAAFCVSAQGRRVLGCR